MNNKMWVGHTFNHALEFGVPDDYELVSKSGHISDGRKYLKVAGICWYTNIDIKKRHDELILYKSYYKNPELYPKYANYDAIEVSKVVDIPYDYEGEIGLPVTFLNSYNPEQFEIIGTSLFLAIPIKKCIPVDSIYEKGGPRFYIKTGEKTYKRCYDRIVVRRRKKVA